MITIKLTRSIVLHVIGHLCDMYAKVFGKSNKIEEYFKKLHVHVKNECSIDWRRHVKQLIGHMDCPAER